MAEADVLVWLLVVVIAIEGVWMAGLTYLLWRDHVRKRAALQAAPEPPKTP